MKKVIPVAVMRRDTPVETAAVVDAVDVADHSLRLQDAMYEKPAAHITEELSMTEHSLILLTTVANRWNSSAVQAR